jgi:hypothetical protein
MNSIVNSAAKITEELKQLDGKSDANRLKWNIQRQDWERFKKEM